MTAINAGLLYLGLFLQKKRKKLPISVEFSANAAFIAIACDSMI